MEMPMLSKIASSDSSRSIRDMLRDMPPPEWVRQMIDYHRLTGAYRPEDLERLLGDPNKRVEVLSETSVAALLGDLQGRS